jgi:hypothetical protein
MCTKDIYRRYYINGGKIVKKIKFIYLLLLIFSLFVVSGCNDDEVIDTSDKVKPTVVINNPTTSEAGIVKLPLSFKEFLENIIMR